jgi:hypothetical protein
MFGLMALSVSGIATDLDSNEIRACGPRHGKPVSHAVGLFLPLHRMASPRVLGSNEGGRKTPSPGQFERPETAFCLFVRAVQHSPK